MTTTNRPTSSGDLATRVRERLYWDARFAVHYLDVICESGHRIYTDARIAAAAADFRAIDDALRAMEEM